MEDGIRSAEVELEDLGFDCSSYNTDKHDTVCHIIGHREIYADINDESSDNISGDNYGRSLGIFSLLDRKSIENSGGGTQPGFRTDGSDIVDSLNRGRDSEVLRSALNLNNTDCTRTLVVVDIRGSVTKAALKLIMTYAALIYTQKQISH